MKQFLYLDTDIVNSILIRYNKVAQIEKSIKEDIACRLW